MRNLTDKFTLNDGFSMPIVGFGTYLSTEQECYDAVRHALKVGYRHIDTASFYKNERVVGDAVRDSKINRDEIFVTTKLWNTDQGYDSALRAFEKSYENLNPGYVDLYLIHWPIPTGHAHDYRTLNADSWKAMNERRGQGLIRSLGVSNFLPEHIDQLCSTTEYAPVVNQIEMHPGLNQTETVEYCLKRGIVVEAWRPVMKGLAGDQPVIAKIANETGASTAQVCIAWLLSKGVCPLPKSVTPARIAENAEAINITLTKEQISAIDDMPEIRLGSHPLTLNK